jgi:hypothetical protein
MSNRIVTFGLLALGGALGGVWWLRRSAGALVAPRELAPALHDAARPRVPTRRERYLASLEREVLEDAPPPSGDWAGLAQFEDEPLSVDGLTARPHAEPPRLYSADDCEAVDADSLAQVFLARATDSVQE